jgi:hypothetical protein
LRHIAAWLEKGELRRQVRIAVTWIPPSESNFGPKIDVIMTL